ncbi:superoxide dismutase family protein [Brevundimonas sp. R86498]|uniref:superoxide dismutase family protein n=1 Tax=Brevundimonas sp. R86498 TaxID=3093845 RepID=UPI0037C67031
MRFTALAALAVSLPLTACVSVTENDYSAPAVARAPMGDFGEATLVNATGARIGRAVLTQGSTGLLIRIEATGLTPGWHGVHIHATGECAAPFTSAGAHVNHGDPKAPHGLLNAAGPDDGDLPNIHAGADGAINAEVFTTRARIAREGPGQWLWDADGSALVIHANADDHRTQPIGGAGDRVACGVMAAG